jgi:hypothetical protein
VAIASVCSLAAQASAGWSDTFTGEVIGRDQLELWASGLERFAAERARHDAGPSPRFFDVRYEDLVRDPVGTAESVYGYFGLPLSGAAADAMRQLTAGDASQGRPSHRYTLGEFGLTEETVAQRFGPAIIAG